MVLKRVKQKQISLGYCDARTGQRVYPPPPVDQMSELLPEQEPPEQLATAADGEDSEAVDVRLTSYPPLARSTIISPDQHNVLFTVLLERLVNHKDLQGWEEPQVSLWHSHNGEHNWEELKLKPTSGNDQTLLINHCAQSIQKTAKTWFAASLSGLPKHGHSVKFTLKWRIGPKVDWNWIKDSTGMKDGELLYQACGSTDLTKHADHDFSHFFNDISKDIEVSSEAPETNHTLLYSLTCPISPAKDQDSGYSHHRLGIAKHCSRWFALVRLWSPWLAPRHGDGGQKFELDKEAVLLSFLRKDGYHVVCLAISGLDDVLTTFIHGDDGVVEIKGRNDRESAGTSRVLVAVADSFEVANCAVMYHARKVVAQLESSESVAGKEIETLTDEKVRPEYLEEWYDGLSYCTWNSLGQGLTAQKIIDALADLSKNEINITNLIIDDNWQTLSSGDSQFERGWSKFEANPSGFPDGLKKLTTFIRQKYPHVQHIAVWHAILGYWGGIDAEGNIAEKYKTIEVEKEPGVAGGKFTVVAGEDAQQMYDDFYSFLAANGIDGVKTDAQFFLDMLQHAPDRRNLITEYQDAWTLAHLRHLSSKAISCMSQFPQAIFHSQLPTNKPKLLLRNSDDFFPEVEASHAWHIFCNAHNSLLTQHLNALPDWDMFQTSHSWAAFHAAARCVSGGPIYFTDKPGEHDLELLGQMCAQNVQGRTVILRPERVGRAMGVYDSYEAGVLLKVGTYVGLTGTGSGILGVFNVAKKSLREFVRLEEFPGVEGEGEYVVGSFRVGEVSKPVKKGGENAFVGVEMGIRGWEILTAYAVRSFKIHSEKEEAETKVAVMGLVEKMTGAAAVRSADMYLETNGRLRIRVALKALGVLGLWISDLKERSLEDDFMVTMYGKPVPVSCVEKGIASGRGDDRAGVLEIDVAKAWKENKEEAGYNNEVEVEVLIG